MNRPTALRPLPFAAVACLFALLVFSRKPDALLHAELWGDEGWSFYPDAYRLGVRCLLVPAGGYLDTIQRLVGLLAQLLPLSAVPTAFAVAAFVVQLMPALFLVSTRLETAVPSPAVRLLLALLTLCTPNAMEVFVNLTNTQWMLALLALLVVIGRPPRTMAGQVFDAAVLLLSGLSGPFGLMLIPVVAWRWRELPCRATQLRLFLVLLAAAIQIAVMLSAAHDARSHAPLGAGPRMLAQVLATQVVLAAEIGWRELGPMQVLAVWRNNVLPVALVLLATVIALGALWRGPVALRQAALFVGLMLAAGLLTPQVSLDRPRWEIMTHPPMGNRYFALPVMLWMAMLVSLTADRSRVWRAAGILWLLPVLFWAIPHEWSVLTQPRTDFVARARLFETSPPGTTMTFPIIPPGLTPMQLTKKPD